MAFTNPIRQRLSAHPFRVVQGGNTGAPDHGHGDASLTGPTLKTLSAQYRAWKTRRRAFQGLAATFLSIALIAGAFYLATRHSDWDRMTILKHIAAFPNCAAAREMGLAPTRRGEPGYYVKHDRDRDGIACEVWPGR